MALEQFDWFPAEFQPRRRDDLTPLASEWIGWRGIWEAAFVIEDGPYEGEFACTVKLRSDGTNGGLPYPPAEAFAWVPHLDLLPAWLDADATQRATAERRSERTQPTR